MPTDVVPAPKKVPSFGEAMLGLLVIAICVVVVVGSVSFSWHAGTALAAHVFGGAQIPL